MVLETKNYIFSIISKCMLNAVGGRSLALYTHDAIVMCKYNYP